MSGIERALAGNPFTVDPTQCYLAAQAVQKFTPSESKNPWSDAPVPAQIVFKLFFVAICHQINWDFLQRRMFERFFHEEFTDMLGRAKGASAKFVSDMLEGYHRPERIRAAERARYLRSTAEAIDRQFGNDPFILVAEGRVFGDKGLLEVIRVVPAFGEDPLSKKANAFAQELARERIVEFSDDGRIPPAIDYHLIRLYLRTGRVIASDRAVFRALRTGSTHRMRLVNLLRESVAQALQDTASFARIPVHELNYLEWQIGRNRCERDFTICDGPWPSELLDSSIIAISNCCPLRDSCIAYQSPGWKEILEPELKKAFY